MQPYMKFVEQFAIERLLSEKSPVTHRHKIGFSLYAASGVLLCIAIAFGSFGAYLYLNTIVEGYLAAISTAGIFLLTTLLFICIASIILQRKTSAKQVDQTQDLKQILNQIDQDYGDYIAKNPKVSLAIAVGAGFLLKDKTNLMELIS